MPKFVEQENAAIAEKITKPRLARSLRSPLPPVECSVAAIGRADPPRYCKPAFKLVAERPLFVRDSAKQLGPFEDDTYSLY